MITPHTKNTQQQLIQLELKFAGPLVYDSIVESVNDLIALDTNYAYKHKMVWVREKQAYYYIEGNLDGSQINHWKEFSTKLTIEEYSSTKNYLLGDIVYFQNKLYRSTQPVIGINPISDKTKWYSLSGEIITQRFTFENESEFKFRTNIPNPIFKVILGDIEREPNSGRVILNEEGFAKINNQQVVEADIVQDESVPYNNGYTYLLSLYEEEKPIAKSGVIIIK